ncbi:carbohydrate-binding domain-containing protein [Microbacterium sp. zg.Y909]|uniref:carbohydrate-binding domain-containing protein n=1 Tax=Microbacterium sp. zg.Y909 TaxID=2969413 RepID=UPI00214BD6DB|nr:carbohydrate-binding domain-containing protein [Microbacterium sp. zg.Y909]MCR2824861.1 carbohydrate-binding domain-containing protein [Microbacterium sp. zg.Y909]
MTPSRDTRRPGGRRLWLAAAPAVLALALAGCGQAASPAASTPEAATPEPQATTVDTTLDGFSTAADVIAGNQQPHDDPEAAKAADAETIALGGSTARTDAAGVKVDGSTVTVTAAGAYVLEGDLEGQVVVAAPDDAVVTLVLDGADIAHTDGPAIDVQSADEAIVVLAEGSANTLSDAAGYAEDADANAALFSAADLTLTGTGSLTVTGNGNDGIASKDGLVIQSGDISVDAVDDGIRGKDYLVIRDGDIDVTAGGDGLKADNEEDAERGYVHLEGGDIEITADADGIDAFTDVVQTGGTVTVTAGGGASSDPESGAKGIVAGNIVVLESGSATVDAADDAVHSDGYAHLAGSAVTLTTGDDGVHAELQLVVSGGDVTVASSVEGLESGQITVSGGTSAITADDDGLNVSEPDAGTAALTLVISGGDLVIDAQGDGLDANGTAEITGGTTIVHGTTEGGNGAIDVDGGTTVSGGTLFAMGSAGMAQAPSPASPQASVQFAPTAMIPAGTELAVLSSSGEKLGSVTTPKSVQNVVFSAPGLADGDTLTLTADGAVVATAVAGEQNAGGMGGLGGPGGPGGPAGPLG